MVDEIYSSRASFENALEKAKQEKRWSDAGSYLRDACLLYTDLVDDLKASLLEAAEYFEKEGNKAEQAWCYHDLGGWYLEATKGDEAVQWLEKSISLFEEIKDEPWAKEGLQSTQSVLNEILSEKPFSSKKSKSEKWTATIQTHYPGENNDPTDIPAILMTLGSILALMSIIPTYITLNFFGIAAFFSLCSGGLILFMIGLVRFIKIKLNK